MIDLLIRNCARPSLWAILALVLFANCSRNKANVPPKPLPVVKVAQPIKKQIVEWDAYTGRLEAVDFVEVRARVSGELQSVHFDEGQIVEKGKELFVIDPRPFQAEVNVANAKLKQIESQLRQSIAKLAEAKSRASQAKVQLDLAKSRLERTTTLAARDAVAKEDLDQRDAEFLQAEADIKGTDAGVNSAIAAMETAQAEIDLAQTGVETAELNLGYTRILAPIDGRISSLAVTAGNLITGGTATATLLTTITSIEPIYCVFDASEQEVLKYMRLAASGERDSSRDTKNRVYLGLVDEEGFPHRGYMDFVDNRFDTDTASMRARCIFANEDKLLLPGMFARIRIPGSAPHEAVLIPDSAIGTDQSSQYVYIVVDDVIQRRAITLGPIVDGLRVIEGLEGDETLVIEGLLQARPGSKVEKVPGTIEIIDDGLPDHYDPVLEDEWISPKTSPLPEETSNECGPTLRAGVCLACLAPLPEVTSPERCNRDRNSWEPNS